jgi:hypothetical protein
MKSKLLFLQFMVIVFAVISGANTVESVFLTDSLLPEPLKIKILKAIKTKCKKGVTDNGLQEIATVIVNGDNDRDINERRFRTELSSRSYFDDLHAYRQVLVVESTEQLLTAIAASEFKVLKIQGNCN